FQFAADRILAGVLLEQLGDLLTEFVTRPTEVSLENLAHVHTAGNAERIQHDFHRRAVFEVRHVLVRQDSRDDALVAVTAGHLVSNAQLALHRDVDLDQLDHARRQFVALGELLFLLVDDFLEHVNLTRGHFLDLVDLLIHTRVLVVVLNTLQVPRGDALDRVAVENRPFGQQPLVSALVVQVSLNFLAAQDVLQALQALVGKNSDLVRQVLLQLSDLRPFDCLGPLILFLTLAREDLDVNNDAFDSRRTVERSIANVSGLLAEDRPPQLLFRRELGLTFRSDLADQDVALLYRRANANHAGFVQIAQHGFADVRDVASDFLRPQLGVARLDFELLDVDGGVVVVFHQLLGDEDRVLKVVAAPRHKGDENVTSQRQLAVIRARTVGNDLSLQNPLALSNGRLLINASVLVGPLELGELINIATNFTRQLPGMVFAFHAHDDPFRIDRINNAVALGEDDGARVAGGDAFHSGTHDRRFRTKQRHRLALHVRTHQSSIGVVVLQEGNKRCGDRNQLLRADVDVIHLIPVHQHEVSGFAGVNQLSHDAPLIVEFHVRLRDHVASSSHADR